MNRNIWYLITILCFLVFAGAMLYSVPDTSWSQEKVIENVDKHFMNLEVANSKLNLVYRNSSDSGVMIKTKNAESGKIDSLKNFLGGSNWKEANLIDDSSGSGAYLSAAEINGELKIAYQDASIGNEKVILASKNATGWSKETVDNVNDGGVNVGMYTALTSYQGQPLVLYHSPTQGLKAATKTGNSWSKQVIADNMGWFTDSVSCGEKAFTAYRGRNSDKLRISTFDGSWSTEKLNISLKSSISIGQQNCRPHLLYLTDSEQITYRSPTGKEQVLTGSDYSSVSIDTSQRVQALYYNYGEGLFYAEKTAEGWKKEKLANSSNTGQYNDLAVDEAGNTHVIFTQDSNIIHAEKNTGRVDNLRVLLNSARAVFGGLLIILLFQSFRKIETGKGNIQKIQGFTGNISINIRGNWRLVPALTAVLVVLASVYFDPDITNMDALDKDAKPNIEGDITTVALTNRYAEPRRPTISREDGIKFVNKADYSFNLTFDRQVEDFTLEPGEERVVEVNSIIHYTAEPLDSEARKIKAGVNIN